MIVRVSQDHLLLITQPDHAALAAAVMRVWQRDPIPEPQREDVLLAAAEHDNGWREEDVAPIIDPESGRILDFINTPDPVRHRIWPRAVDRLSARPYAAALVAQHALSVHQPFRDAPGWEPFFSGMTAARDRALAAAAPLSHDDLQRDYFFILIGDMLSLIFCNGWHEPQTLGAYVLQLAGPRLTIRPDPFDRREILLSIAARQLPNVPYASAEAAAAAFRSAPAVTITGVALGAP